MIDIEDIEEDFDGEFSKDRMVDAIENAMMGCNHMNTKESEILMNILESARDECEM